MESKISTLKNDPNNSVNIIDVLKLFAPGEKTKYIELLLRLTMELTSKVDKNNDLKKLMISTISDSYEVNPEELSDASGVQLCFMKGFLDYIYLEDDLKNFRKFCEFNEKGLIKRNDLSNYRRFEEINIECHDAEERERIKVIETQILKVFEDDEWLVLKPLSYESSVKYGYNTKWCTASSDTRNHFDSYSKKGILIYNINKKTNLKVAAFKSLLDNELTYWNQIDKRIDSSESGLPYNIIDLIKNEMKITMVNEKLFHNEYTPKPRKAPKPSPTVSFDDMLEEFMSNNDQTPPSKIKNVHLSITASD
jgi:hypothetical protein